MKTDMQLSTSLNTKLQRIREIFDTCKQIIYLKASYKREKPTLATESWETVKWYTKAKRPT